MWAAFPTETVDERDPIVSKRILVVEDDEIAGEIIARMLVHLGYTPIAVVRSGEEGIRCAKTDVPDLVLMDVVLAGALSGIQAAREIATTLMLPTVFSDRSRSENVITSLYGETAPT